MTTVSDKLGLIYAAAPTAPKSQIVLSLQKVLFEMSGTPRIYSDRIPHVKTALIEYQKKATNYGTALHALANAAIPGTSTY